MKKTQNKTEINLNVNLNLERITLEKDKLVAQFDKIEPRKMKVVERLIDNAAFMSVMLEDIQAKINQNGYMVEYQNGENQWGMKKSPEIEIFNQTISNYSKIIKQLTDLLPVEVKLEHKDTETESIKEFIQGKK